MLVALFVLTVQHTAVLFTTGSPVSWHTDQTGASVLVAFETVNIIAAFVTTLIPKSVLTFRAIAVTCSA